MSLLQGEKKKGRLKIAKLPPKAQRGIFGCPSTSVCVIDKLHTKAPPGLRWPEELWQLRCSWGSVGALSSIPRVGSCQTWNLQQCRGILSAAKPVGAVVLWSKSREDSGKFRWMDHRGKGRRLGLHGRGSSALLSAVGLRGTPCHGREVPPASEVPGSVLRKGCTQDVRSQTPLGAAHPNLTLSVPAPLRGPPSPLPKPPRLVMSPWGCGGCSHPLLSPG